MRDNDEAHLPQRCRAKPFKGRDIDTLKNELDADSVSIPYTVREIHGWAVRQDEVNFGMRNTQSLDRIFDRPANPEGVGARPIFPLGGEKVVRLRVKAEFPVKIWLIGGISDA
jgi:hypothetical protein